MKATIIYIVCVFNVAATAQKPLAVNPPEFYAYEGNDTIHFARIDLGSGFNWNTTTIVDSIQIDGIGRKELIFFRQAAGDYSNHGGTFDKVESKQLSKYEIWNLDTKTLLFEAVCDWKHYKSHFDARVEFASQRTDQKYHYDFAIDRNGIVTIKNFSGTDGVNPDKPNGTYQFIDGKFIRIFE